MRIAISGTPGTGKTSAGLELQRLGKQVIELNDFIREHRLIGKRDAKRDTSEVNIDKLDSALSKSLGKGDWILSGHLSHLLVVDLIIVLRCRPSVLRQRLEERGYSEAKVRENMEAEGCDVILIEALERCEAVYEIDTTERDPGSVADAVLEIIGGEREKYCPGTVDWSEEVLSWF